MSRTSTGGSFALLGAAGFEAIREARLQAHWAAQVVAAAADARLARRPDDSQSNLGWDSAARAFATRDLGGGRQAWMRPADLTLGLSAPEGEPGSGEAFALAGRSLDDAFAWMAARLDAGLGEQETQPGLREYDLPSHPVRDGAPFDAASEALAEVANWFDGAARILADVATSDERASEPRCWPHHFDVATLITIDADLDPEVARSIGVGLSPGDGGIPDPYFYVNPWPRPDAASATELPGLAKGAEWHVEGFVGALVHAERILAVTSEAREAWVRAAVREAIETERELLGDDTRKA